MAEIAPAGSVAGSGTWQQGGSVSLSRPCFRSVPAHRIVGGGLGRRYDHAVRLSEHHHYSDDHHHNQSPPSTTRVHRGRQPPPFSRGPRETGHPHQPSEFSAAGGVVVEAEPPDPVQPENDLVVGRGRQEEEHADGAVGRKDAAGVRVAGGGAAAVMLTSLCLEAMVGAWESHSAEYLPRAYHMPHELCARLLRMLVASRKLTAFSLSGFLNPAALEVDLSGCSYVPKSVFKQLGFSCPRIVHLNLSMCSQVNNAIVRSVLQGCSSLRQLYLDGCRHVTDAGFHLQQSPFYVLLGAVSLETISVQGCPQVTGDLVLHLRKVCRNLKELDLARCKSVTSASVRRLFDSCPSMESLNVSFLESVVDEAFEGLPAVDMQPPLDSAVSSSSSSEGALVPYPPPHERLHTVDRVPYSSPFPCSTITTTIRSSSLPALRHLNLARCEGVTDLALARVGGAFPGLEGVHLEHCLRVTDEGVRALAVGCRGLTALGLRNCGQITDDALEALSVHCPSLEWLDFSWCGEVSDKAVVRLAEGCPGLEEVRAIWCENLTDVSLSALSKVCTRLEALHIVGCGGVTSSAVVTLRKAGVEVFQ